MSHTNRPPVAPPRNPPDPLETFALIPDPEQDQVAVALWHMSAGLTVMAADGPLTLLADVERGHRFALRDLPEGTPVVQYGHPFGRSKGIQRGEPVNANNVAESLPECALEPFIPPPPTRLDPTLEALTFDGYLRPDGRAGTRNHYLVIPTSMCASDTARLVVETMTALGPLIKGVDSIAAAAHTEGCGCAANQQIDRVLRILVAYAVHPNVGGCLVMDLGCEQTNYEAINPRLRDLAARSGRPVDWVTIQRAGGVRKAIDEAVGIIRERLPQVATVQRQPRPISELVIGTECGASDGFSGISANPVIGRAVDRLVHGGGRAILSEIPEMVGVFGMLKSRFRSPETAQAFLNAIEWYESLGQKLGVSLADNLVPKNAEGGLINRYIKSLGAVMKGGSTPIEDVVDYGAPLTCDGLSVMQGPGGDPESVTGLVASGATLVLFSTGKGAISGNIICPVIKVSSNSELARTMPEDIDFDAGRILDGASLDALGELLFRQALEVASGTQTWTEQWRQRQFQIWTAGKLAL
ncbi:MAG: altronate dehydratase [Magnetococcales bacterium]|nr:altronate dehydratase [Magnetococcales bacterium]